MLKIKDYLLENKFTFLFTILIVYFLLSAFLETALSAYVFGLLFSLVVLSSLVVVSEARRALLWSSLLLGLISILTLASGLSEASREFMLLYEGLSVVFLALITFASAHTTFNYSRVDAQTIFGALCTYLMMGMLWSMIYSCLYTFDPTSFKLSLTEDTNRFVQHSFTYYSYVTLSTLGYGDITPVSSVARTFAWLEAVFGQAYLTILIAQIVGQYIAQKDYS